MPLSTRQVGVAILTGMIAYAVISRSAARRTGQSALSRTMPLEEAYLLFGLEADATRSAVLAVHRKLMKLIHPDRGGTAYLAAKINEAKAVLLQHIKV